ncbi:MAG: hypothetical protein Q8936_05520 [Bacillota bacterium]|nr:hypothetical protein [Bacillota bacterium]
MLRRCISLGILLVISFIPTLVLNIRYVKQDEISIQKAMQYVIDNNMITYINNQIIVKPQGNLLYLMAILATGIIVFNNKLTIIRKCFLVYSTLAFILINNDMIIHILIKICPIWILWRLPNIIPIWVIVVYLIFAMENIVYQLGNSVKKIDKRVVMLVYSIFFAYIFIQLTKLDYIKMNTYKFMYISIYLLILIYIGIMFGLIVEKYLSINVQKSSISVLVLVVLVSVTDPGKITLEVINKRFISSIVYSSTYGYGPEDIVDGQWDNELIDYINKRIPDHSMIAFSSKGTGEVTICFKNINILSSANATPNEELYVRQIENEKLFNKTTKLEEVKEILGKYKIKYIIITPSFKAAVSMYKDYQKVYSKNGYYIIRIN